MTGRRGETHIFDVSGRGFERQRGGKEKVNDTGTAKGQARGGQR